MAKEVHIEIARLRDVCSDKQSLRVTCSFTVPYDASYSRDMLVTEFVEALKYDCAKNLKTEIKYSVD